MLKKKRALIEIVSEWDQLLKFSKDFKAAVKNNTFKEKKRYLKINENVMSMNVQIGNLNREMQTIKNGYCKVER